MKNISFSIKRKLQVKNRVNIQIQKFPTTKIKLKIFINKNNQNIKNKKIIYK